MSVQKRNELSFDYSMCKYEGRECVFCPNACAGEYKVVYTIQYMPLFLFGGNDDRIVNYSKKGQAPYQAPYTPKQQDIKKQLKKRPLSFPPILPIPDYHPLSRSIPGIHLPS